MSGPDQRAAILNEEHLRLLSIGYYAAAGVTAFFSLFGLLYVGLGIMIATVGISQPHPAPGGAPPALMGWIFSIMGALVFLLFLTMAVLKFLAGRFIRRRTHRIFCLVVASLTCLSFPYGTLLGIASFIVLGRTSTALDFEKTQPFTNEDQIS